MLTILLSQRSPVYSIEHEQMYESSTCEHFPPFKQGRTLQISKARKKKAKVWLG